MKTDLSSIQGITSLEEITLPEGLLPPNEYPHLLALRARALDLVKGQTLDDINALLEQLEFALLQAREGFEADFDEKWSDKQLAQVQVWDADRLLYLLKKGDPKDHPAFAQDTWPLCFAALALRWYQSGVHAAQNPIRFIEEPTTDALPPTPVERSVESAYQFQQADKLVSAAELLLQHKQENRQQRKSAAKARYVSSTAIKERFITFYLSKEHASKAAAARAFYKTLSQDEQRIIAPVKSLVNMQRTLIKALNAHLKKHS